MHAYLIKASTPGSFKKYENQRGGLHATFMSREALSHADAVISDETEGVCVQLLLLPGEPFFQK